MTPCGNQATGFTIRNEVANTRLMWCRNFEDLTQIHMQKKENKTKKKKGQK